MMLYYILQVLIVQAVFLFFYDLFLHRESFFKANRWYLLSTGILSYIFPLIKINRIENPIITEPLQPVIISSQSIKTHLNQHVTVENNNLLLYVYIAGVIIMLIWSFYKLYKIYNLIKSNSVINYNENLKIVLLQNHREAFTFFKYIFIEKMLYQNPTLPVLQHELVHYREKHWVDLFIFEILKILFWFSPFIWMYQSRINAVHEFIADKQVLKQYNFTDYFHSLLQEHFNSRKISFINQFYKPSILKTRVMIQKKQTTKRQAVLKYLSFGLILSGLILMVNACNDTTSDKKPENVNEQTVKDAVNMQNDDKQQNVVEDNKKMIANENGEVPFHLIEQPPVYPGCEGKTGSELKDCMNKNIQEFIVKNFNKDLAKSLKIEKGGKIRILSQFIINKEGKVEKVKARSKYPVLEKEAIRVISMLPQMKPGMVNGKPVDVIFSLPLIFVVEE